MESSAVAAFFDRVGAALRAGTSVRARPGLFYLLEYAGYEGRNPRTGAVVVVPPKRALHFVASDELAVAALGSARAEPFARANADAETQAEEIVQQTVEVPCSDDELGAVAAAAATTLISGGRAELLPYAVVTVRTCAEDHLLRIQLEAGPGLLDAPSPG